MEGGGWCGGVVGDDDDGDGGTAARCCDCVKDGREKLTRTPKAKRSSPPPQGERQPAGTTGWDDRLGTGKSVSPQD